MNQPIGYYGWIGRGRVYKHTIKIQNPTITRDTDGGFKPVQHNTGTWTDTTVVKASIEALRGKSYDVFFRAEQQNIENLYRIRFRFSKNTANAIKPKTTRLFFNDCSVDKNRLFRIETMNFDHREIEVVAVEVF